MKQITGKAVAARIVGAADDRAERPESPAMAVLLP